MKDADLAYTAGIIDGEGSIGIYNQVRKNNRKGFQARLSVGNTNESLLKWLKDTYGGNIYLYSDGADNLNWKLRWAWAVTGSKVLEILTLVYPYLKIKKAQAEIAIKFQEGRMGKGHPLTNDSIEVAQTQRDLILRLNKRGRLSKGVTT